MDIKEIAEEMRDQFGIAPTLIAEPKLDVHAIYYANIVAFYKGDQLIICKIPGEEVIATFDMAYLDDPAVPTETIYTALQIEGVMVI